MKTTIKTQIKNMTVELTNDTRNGTRYLLCIGNRRIYTSEDLTLSNEDLIWLTEKCDLNSAMVLPKIIMMYKDAEAETEDVTVEGTTDALGVTYKAYEIPEGFDAEAEEVNLDNNISLLVDIKSKVKTTISKIRKESLYDLSGRVHNILGKLVKAPIMPSLDKVYDKTYYGKFEVKPRFSNWNGSAQLI